MSRIHFALLDLAVGFVSFVGGIGFAAFGSEPLGVALVCSGAALIIAGTFCAADRRSTGRREI